MSTTKQSQYPEHDRMSAVKDKAYTLGAFLEWLESDGRRIAEPHTHRGEECAHAPGEPHGCGKFGEPGLNRYYLPPLYTWEPPGAGERIERILAAYLGIDLDKIRDEKEQIYKALVNSAKEQSK